MEIFNIYHIEAARKLPGLPTTHPCASLHGHSFQVQLFVSGPVNPGTGWVMDFADLDAAFAPIQQQLDHRCLNDVHGLENPTSENLARWIWQNLKPAVPGLSKIVIQETHKSGCVYRGD